MIYEVDILYGLAVIFIFFIIGIGIGWYFGKRSVAQSIPSNDTASLIPNLYQQIVDIKSQFSNLEKNRIEYENFRAKIDEERDQRLNAFIVNASKTANEQENRSQVIEKNRDIQIQTMTQQMQLFNRAISGTKSRGMMGEQQLEDTLNSCIRTELVTKNLKTESGNVEFGWKLFDGKFIPIDCKLPDIIDLLDKYHTTDDVETQKSIKNSIINKFEKEIKRVQKYQNLSNTINKCIIVVPEGILEIAPDLIGLGKEFNVYVCSYKDVFLITNHIEESYLQMKETGDIGKYRFIVESLFQILEKIETKVKTIETAITQITNATRYIRGEVFSGKSKISSIHELDIQGDETNQIE